MYDSFEMIRLAIDVRQSCEAVGCTELEIFFFKAVRTTIETWNIYLGISLVLVLLTLFARLQFSTYSVDLKLG